jgi:hypothetical protein
MDGILPTKHIDIKNRISGLGSNLDHDQTPITDCWSKKDLEIELDFFQLRIHHRKSL